MNFVLKKYFKKKLLRGFSLGEVLLAGFVLTVGLLATVSLITKSLKNSFETRDTIVAVLLAQEGVELVRNVRDNDFAKGSGNDGFNNSDGFADGLTHCYMNHNDSVMDCRGGPGGGGGNGPLGRPELYYLEYVSGLYEHTETQGKFSRYIHIDYDNTKKEAEITSFVFWGDVDELVNLVNIEDGETANCNVANKCVYTEIFLNSWYTAP